jgi:hypothetical protein
MRSYVVSAMKSILVACLAVTAVGALGVSSAAADGWFVNGAELTGTQTAALATTAVTDAAPVLHVPALPLKISCTGPLEGVSPKIAAPNSGSATSLKFTECTVIEPTTCKLSTPEIKTEEVTATVSLASGTADHILFKPTSAKHFAEFTLEGTSCSISGKKAVTGSVVLKAGTGQLESAVQALEGLGSLEQGGDSLQTANDPSYIEGGKALLQLASGASWSFGGGGGPSDAVTVNFGLVALGGEKTETIIVTAHGKTKYGLAGIDKVAGEKFEIVQNTCSGTEVNANVTCEIKVSYKPPVGGLLANTAKLLLNWELTVPKIVGVLSAFLEGTSN